MTDFPVTKEIQLTIIEMIKHDYPSIEYLRDENDNLIVQIPLTDIDDWDYVYNRDPEDEDPRMLDNIQVLLRKQNKI